MAFVFKGAYKATTSYSRYDAASSGDIIYQYINPTAGAGHPVTDDNYWMPYGEGGSQEGINLEARIARDAYASLDARLDALLAIINERCDYGVVSGLVVSAQSTPDMTVKVSAGTVYFADGTRYIISAVPEVEVTEADATNGRIDIVYVDEDGVVAYLAGTAGETPAAPATPSGGFALAEIAVASEATTVIADNITDKRKMILGE